MMRAVACAGVSVVVLPPSVPGVVVLRSSTSAASHAVIFACSAVL
jgi:hypothetical protein